MVATLCTCVAELTISERDKLVPVMKYFRLTKAKMLRINTSGDLSVMEWMIDAPFNIQTDLKSYTGATLHMGGNQMGVLQVIS